MSETYQFGLPLVQAAQAQKHITVNEAIARLDAVSQMRIVSRFDISPPASPVDGQMHIVPSGGVGDWTGYDGKLAIFVNGGWDFFEPKIGWRAWDEIDKVEIVFDGVNWVSGSVAISAGGAATQQKIIEIDHQITTGGDNLTTSIIPSHAQVIGVTGRVIAPLTGAGVSSWSLGVAGSIDRYGSGLGLTQNSFVKGMSGTPTTYWGDTPLLISADAGSFDGGIIRLAVHMVELVVPRAV